MTSDVPDTLERVVVAARPTNQPPRIEPAAPRTLAQLEEALRAEKTDRGLRIRLSTDDLFGTARDTLSPEADPSLSSVVDLIKAMRPREIVVLGTPMHRNTAMRTSLSRKIVRVPSPTG